MALVRRVLLMLGLIWAVLTVTFFMIRLVPGNPVKLQLLNDIAQGMNYAQALHEVEILFDVNLKQPLFVQYLGYLGGLLHGDLGKSVMFPQTPIAGLIAQTLPWTLFTVTSSIIVSFVIGVVLGTAAAYRRDGWLDKLITPSSSVLNGIPNYLVGTIVLFVFAVVLRWFPTQGAYNPAVPVGFTPAFIGSALYHGVLPIASYVISSWALWYLLMKSNTVSVLGADFINGARAHGVPERRIMLGYVAPNAMLPLVTGVVLQLAYHFSGSVLVETIFDYPGIGYLFTQAALNSDYSLLQALFGVLAVIIIVANFIADILYTKLDPRIHLEDIA